MSTIVKNNPKRDKTTNHGNGNDPLINGQRAQRRSGVLKLVSKFLKRLESFPKPLVHLICTLAICTIGLLTEISGPGVSTSLLFLIPVLVVTRLSGLWGGVAAAFMAAIVWHLADRQDGYVTNAATFADYWNLAMRLGTFLVVVSLVAAMRDLTAHLEGRVVERTAELEAQIAENRELEEAILEISDRERAAIGQDLHDGLCQQLVGAAFSANMLREKIANNPASAVADADLIADLIDDSITQARNLARGLYPVRLETEGLELAMREMAATMSRRFNIICSVECPQPLPACGPNTGIQLYRIAQEAVTNAAKHSGSKAVTISLTFDQRAFHMEIKDSGGGMEMPHTGDKGMGLSIMEYRARMIGAEFHLQSGPGRGMRVSCTMTPGDFTATRHEH